MKIPVLVELIWLCPCGILGHAQLKEAAAWYHLKIATKSVKSGHFAPRLTASYRWVQVTGTNSTPINSRQWATTFTRQRDKSQIWILLSYKRHAVVACAIRRYLRCLFARTNPQYSARTYPGAPLEVVRDGGSAK
ncbi:hypothetical protein PF008_g7808 [Phytophthora fragariae]|uniref:Secreted protein n=1 Tax=Phytophthora fragariae TaxID=53985 RepID=A0A6G0S1D7_9STRA|nr:hypothetical protein PF008_g7808 [Phytophthora fragariae]